MKQTKERIFIIEGTDGTGKSELAHELARGYGYDYKHAGPPTQKHWYEEYCVPTLPYAQTGGLVLDRWHLGEWVWPAIFNREGLFQDLADLEACHNFLVATHNLLTVVLTRDLQSIVDVHFARNESPYPALEGAFEFDALPPLATVLKTDLPTAKRLLL